MNDFVCQGLMKKHKILSVKWLSVFRNHYVKCSSFFRMKMGVFFHENSKFIPKVACQGFDILCFLRIDGLFLLKILF